MPLSLEPFARLGLALALGLLAGVERGWRARDRPEGGRTAGVRTYALTAMLGAVAALLTPTAGGWVFATLGGGVAAAFILFKQREQAGTGEVSVTDVVAAILVFALGAYAVVGDWRVAAAAGVATTGLMAAKPVLHAWLARLTWAELRSALILLAMSFIALPVLPNRGFGPYGLVNPYELWLLTIVIAAVSFVAYAAMKAFGTVRGLALASALGALVSSTAMTLSLARMNRAAPRAVRRHAGAALLAGAVMAARIGAIALVVAPSLVTTLAAPLGVFALVSLALALVGLLGKDGSDGAAAELKSPFDLALVLKFAAVLGLVMAGVRVLTGVYGAAGVLPAAVVAGLIDTDAATLAVARMTTDGLAPGLAAAAILLAAAADTGSKSVIAAVVGGRSFGLLFAGGSAVAAAAAAAVFFLLPA